MDHNLTAEELREAVDATKVILTEAAKGSLNDFWVVIDCDSENFRDYMHRSNTQGLINIVCQNHKALCTRKKLDSVALFSSSDKDKAEKEAKRRAKLMKIELVNEAACDKCAMTKEMYETQAYKHKANAQHETDAGMKRELMNMADKAMAQARTAKCKQCASTVTESRKCHGCTSVRLMHTQEAQKHRIAAKNHTDNKIKLTLEQNAKNEEAKAKSATCSKCSGPISENFYNGRNVVSKERTSGASTDDTVYKNSIKALKPYTKGDMDAVENERDQKVKVPNELIKLLTSRANDAKAYSEKLNVTQSEDKQFYLDLSQMFNDLNAYLKGGTVHDIKMASTFMTSLMGPMLFEIPTEVVRFITYGGSHTPLKSFMNSITVPKGGFDANGSARKDTKKK